MQGLKSILRSFITIIYWSKRLRDSNTLSRGVKKTIVYFGLIMNEISMNSVKYDFEGRVKATIQVVELISTALNTEFHSFYLQ